MAQDVTVSIKQGKGSKKGIYSHPNPDGTWTETQSLPANLPDRRYYEAKGFKFLRYHFDQPLSAGEQEMERLRAQVEKLEKLMAERTQDGKVTAPVAAGSDTQQAHNAKPTKGEGGPHRHRS